MIGHAADAHAHAGAYDFIVEDAVVDGGFAVVVVLADDGEFHVCFLAAEEVDTAPVFPLAPLTKVDAGAIPNVEDFAAFGGVLAKLACGLSFEGARFVFLFACLLVGDGEMA